MASLARFLPAGGLSIVDDQLTRLSAQDAPQLGWALVISLALSLWSASAGLKALFEAMNVVNGEDETRGFIALNAMAPLLTICGIFGAALALAVVVVLPAVLGLIGMQSGWLFQLAGYLLLACLIFGGILVLCRFGPSRRRAKWRWAFPGAGLSVTMVLAFSAAFSWYSANLASYDGTYGSLGALIGLLTWIWLSIAIVVLGAELNAELEHQTAVNTTVSPELPLGRRGAHMADTVGRSRLEKP